MSEATTTQTPAELFRDFDNARFDLSWDTPKEYDELTPELRARIEDDMEVLIAAWYRLHVATEPES